MTERAPYSRVYWTVRNDDRLKGIYSDDHHWATWNRLLLAADMAWPAPADLPANARRASLRALQAAGVIELLPGGLFCFHGLDTERGRRREAAAASAAHRTPTGRLPDASRTGTERLPSLAEPRLDKPSQRAPAREGPKDPLREAQRAAYIERYGNGSDTPVFVAVGTDRNDGIYGVQPSPIATAAEQEREALRLEALALHERHLAGELGPAEYERLLADLGKPDDDLTRVGA